MRRTIRVFFAAGALLAVAACSDSDTRTSRSILPTDPSTVTTVTPDIDQQIIDLFPTGLETSAGVRWRNVTEKLLAGDRTTGEQMFWELVDWSIKKSGRLEDPTGPLTSQNALMQLISDMYAYVFPDRPRPPTSVTGDATIGLLLPNVATTIVTPSRRAGLAVPEGSAPEPMLVVIQEIDQRFTELCSGPLGTTLCQYPLFYSFEPFPHRRLLKAARFGVCHVNTGAFAPPEGIHDRFRLAHDAPAVPTPGSILVDEIEILPLTSVADFVTCENVSYSLPDIGDASGNVLTRGGLALLRAGSAAARWLFVPKNAYAIDQGGGGESLEFSNFAVVDPVRRDLIDFETLPGGVSLPAACSSLCSITREYAAAGVTFDFIRATDGATLGYVTMRRGGPNASADPNNHDIVNSQVFETGGGFWNGTMIMRFAANPTSVRYLLRVNNTSGPVPINAYGPDGETPVPASQVTRSSPVVFPKDCVECVIYREETITVSNATGISRIQMPGGAYLLAVDDMLIGPVPAPPPIP